MTRDELLALAARVEAAQSADQGFDEAIYTALGWAPDPVRIGTWCRVVNGVHYSQHFPPPAFTASLDAAASLVPEGWQWTVGGRRPINGGAWADVQPNSPQEYAGRRAATPALALTAAALRAIAEEAGE